MNSIRHQLLVWQIGALLLTGLLVSLITYILAWDGFNRVRDFNLEQIAYSVLRHGAVSESDLEEPDAGQFVSQIWDEKGQLVYTSNPDLRLPAQMDGTIRLRWDGDLWHVHTLRKGGLTIQVANTRANRYDMFREIAIWMLLPLALLITLLGGLIWLAVGRALAPLDQVRAEIACRDAPRLHALETTQLPDELRPLVDTLNALLARLDSALDNQRQFIADAAHELRTPLAAVRLQAQLAQRTPQVEERAAALANLLDGVERAGRLIEQLLRLARLEPKVEREDADFELVRLDELAKSVVAEFSARAESRAIDLGIAACPPARLMGQPDHLRMLLANLIDNAIRYIPEGEKIDVEVMADADWLELSITDTGPGIPEAERERVFERFHRLSGADVPGSGLGLAIVRKIVERHHGEILLEQAPGGGLRVRVRLPVQPTGNAGA